VKENIARFGGDAESRDDLRRVSGRDLVSMLAASPAAKGLFHRGHFRRAAAASARQAPRTKAGRPFRRCKSPRYRAGTLQAARGANIDRPRVSFRPRQDSKGALGGIDERLLAVFDGDVLPGISTSCIRRTLQRHADLIGTNSDEGITFVPGATQPAAFEALIRAGYGTKADAYLAAYPHATCRGVNAERPRHLP
jgi:para-nitrobenzyl esterase